MFSISRMWLLMPILCCMGAALVFVGKCSGEEVCYKDGSCEAAAPLHEGRYLLFDINPGEGFNLRRDVYMRVAAAARQLNEKQLWTLVLPPWGPLYHWQATRGEHRTGVPWSRFFDVASLGSYTPVIEMHQYVKEHGARVDAAIELQDYAEGWQDGRFDEKWHVRPCLRKARFRRSDGAQTAEFWGGVEMRAANVSCVSIQGTSRTLASMLQSLPHRTVLIDRAEAILHDRYGEADFWAARRSMRFANHLAAAAAQLRRDWLSSDDVTDRTELHSDWRQMMPASDSARGGPYLAVHLRRRDFVSGRAKTVPSLKNAASAISGALQKLGLDTVFLATDAPETEVAQLRSLLPQNTVVQQRRSPDLLAGEEAIIDQIVCSRARHFIGSFESTFSFRIQEEREILGFPAGSTFNRLCGDREGSSCAQPTRWRVVYGP